MWTNKASGVELPKALGAQLRPQCACHADFGALGFNVCLLDFCLTVVSYPFSLACSLLLE